MINVINGETPFQILSSSFSIGPSETGYDLQVGADSRNFTTLFSVGANTPRMVTNVANGSYFRLKNNVGAVKVNWQRVCTDEGGGGASGTELSPVSEFPAGAEAGTVIAYSGSSSAAGIYQFDGTDWVEAGGSVDLSAYWTSAQTEEAISAATSGKANAANVSANTRVSRWPAWNEQGIITGTISNAGFETQLKINNGAWWFWQSGSEARIPRIYAPTAAGTAGDILVSTGNGAPVWSAVTGPDMSDYWNSAETKTYVDNRIDGYEEESTITITSTRDAENLDVYVAAMGWMGPNFELYLTDADVEVATLDNAQMRQDGSPTYVPGVSDMYADYRYGFDTSAVLTEAMLGQKFSLSQGGEGSIELNETNFPVSYPQYFVLDKANMEGWFTNTLSSSVSVPGVVKSDGVITKVKKLAQAEYDAITTKDPHTFYIIVSN